MKTNSLLQPDPATDHITGPASAAVTLIEYGDFECPFCAQAYPVTTMLIKHFAADLRFVYRHFPQVAVHPHAELAAEAAEAAGAQGKFWPYHDLLFENREHLAQKHLREYAQQCGIDIERFDYELADHVYRQRVHEHAEGGRKLDVRTTPAFYVNGRYTDVSFGIQHLHDVVAREIGRKR
jgi:protein-disulfide isomerase